MASNQDSHDDAKYPNSPSTGLAPPETRENPGRVYPKTDPSAPPLRSSRSLSPGHIGNPYLFRGAFSKLDHALAEVIELLDAEEHAVGGGLEDSLLLRKLKGWQEELDNIRGGERPLPERTSSNRTKSRTPERGASEEGGLFVD